MRSHSAFELSKEKQLNATRSETSIDFGTIATAMVTPFDKNRKYRFCEDNRKVSRLFNR